jgi:cytochrome c oxidase cbb3-type subunit III
MTPAGQNAMPPKKIKRSVILVGASIAFLTLGYLITLTSVALRAQDKQAASPADANSSSQTEAKALYGSICASCHGLDARGGERGPDIISRPEIVDKTDAELTEILMNGRTSVGMPAFSTLGVGKLSALVAYLRMLEGRGRGASLPGDPNRGKALFFGKAKCAQCHLVSGQGGVFAADLTTYAARLDAEEVRVRIVNPDKDLDPRRGMVDVVLGDSTRLSGFARNEDNFSLQLQTPDGVFYLLNKSDIRTQTYTGKSGMPANYGSTLSAEELNDIVSYMLRVSLSENKKKPDNNSGDRDE